jgi:acid stress chaperone HdeB
MRTAFIGLGTLATILCTSMVAHAQETLDVTKITCDQFVSGQITDSRAISIWFSGYFHGTRNDTNLDVSALQKDETDLFIYCSSHLNAIVMNVVKNGLEATTR